MPSQAQVRYRAGHDAKPGLKSKIREIRHSRARLERGQYSIPSQAYSRYRAGYIRLIQAQFRYWAKHHAKRGPG